MDLPLHARPREKLVERGSHNLSDAELIAILLGTGTRGKNALYIASSLLKQFSPDQLTNISLEELSVLPGVGKVKAIRIKAALELGERIFSPTALSLSKIHSAHDAIGEVKNIIDKRQERIVVLYLNARYELIQKEVIAIGTINSSYIEPRDIFAPAMSIACDSIIIVHNHPSNDTTPSEDDISFTKRIHQTGEVMGITLRDHIIVSKTSYFSFRENKEGKF